MKQYIKYLLLIVVTAIATIVLLSVAVFKIEPVSSTSHQIFGKMLWVTAPDGGMGFRIVDSAHPHYTLKITCYTPDQVCYEGEFIYTGDKLDKVTLSDIGSYLGEDVLLMNGESLRKVE
ncbi:hypothetical protein [Oleidesulfovibrio sp.]|uniref:hypothetical protein n=1 Tax=Oleidesulfovibrio sp. TaxID=2909707 RepID=UPI003A8BAB6E